MKVPEQEEEEEETVWEQKILWVEEKILFSILQRKKKNILKSGECSNGWDLYPEANRPWSNGHDTSEKDLKNI